VCCRWSLELRITLIFRSEAKRFFLFLGSVFYKASQGGAFPLIA
jgi:hypothetical protein